MSYKILILSCNTGEGHNSCAKALKQAFEANGLKCDIYDALSLADEWISKATSDIYEYSITNSMFSTGYAIGEWYSNLKIKPKSPLYTLNAIYAKKLHRLLCDNSYNAVVCTHIFPAEALTVIRKRYDLAAPAFFVATDYVCYPMMAETKLNGYMIAHPDLIGEYVRKGIPTDKLYPTGIPCQIKSSYQISRQEARQIIDSDYFQNSQSYSGKWFMVMGGSMGFGNMMEIVKRLNDRCSLEDRIICLCGRNLKLKEEIEDTYPLSRIIKAIEFTDKIPIFMDACDVIFTKPGGLTSTEALNRGIPIIHTSPIKGIEDQNALFFHNRNMSFSSNDPDEQVDYAFRLCMDSACSAAMIEAQRINRADDACERIMEIMEKHISGL